MKKSWTKNKWRVDLHGILNKFVVIVIIISFLVGPDFARLESNATSPTPSNSIKEAYRF